MNRIELRCRTCYLPMRYSFRCEWFVCDLCGRCELGEALDQRWHRKWLRRWDRITGILRLTHRR